MKKFFTKEMGARIAMMAIAAVAIGVPAFAAFVVPDIVKSFINFLLTALIVIGAFAFMFGAIQMGFAFKNDDADGKSKGMRAMIAGAIVMVVALTFNNLKAQLLPGWV